MQSPGNREMGTPWGFFGVADSKRLDVGMRAQALLAVGVKWKVYSEK